MFLSRFRTCCSGAEEGRSLYKRCWIVEVSRCGASGRSESYVTKVGLLETGLIGDLVSGSSFDGRRLGLTS